MIAFFLVPSLDVIRRSFMNSSGTQFVGFDNYSTVLTNEAFLLALGNTAKFMLVCVPLLLALSLSIALYLRKVTAFRKFLKMTILVPLAIPVFTAAILMNITFDSSGIANGILNAIGVPAVSWLDTDAAFWILVGNYVWRNLGYCTVLWLAALSCIPEEVYEAARIDGAGTWQITSKVVVPLLIPSSAVVTVLSIINAFKVYREAYLVSGSYPHDSIYMLPHLFNNWFASLSMNKLAAAGVLLGMALIVIVCCLFKAWNRSDGIER
ncbi:carbohydrate ABC transporter permease [Eggerthella lenta]|uniref:carbohydrate ABC transporter permease n=1 Tax=Eggerthella lenta TaxID=84112 RepID=UPI001C690D89|nr:sugar ABC transporter permease [Eggerthella lenta]